MAKVPGKGTVLQQELSMVFTAVAQLTSINLSGAGSETYKSTTLDTSGAGHEYAATGYSEGGSVDIEGFYDPALAGHQSISDLVTTPADQNWKVIFADSGTTEMPYTSAGVTFDVNATMDDGLKFSSSHKCDGLPTFPT